MSPGPSASVPRVAAEGGYIPLEALPDEAQSKIRRPAQPKPTQPAPADSASTQKEPNDKKRLFLGLGPDRRAMVDAKAEAVVLWRYYKKRIFREISIGDARKAFCFLWKAGQAGAEERARKALPMLSVRSLYNWDRALAKGGLNALVVQRGQAQAGRGILDTDTRMRDVVLGMLAAHPHAGSTHLAQGLAVRFSSCPHRLPSVRTIRNWTKQWKDGEQGTLGTPTRSGRCERSLRCLHRTGRRRCGFTECALGDRRHHRPMCCCPTGRGTPYSASSTSGAAACCCMSHAHHPRPPSAPRCVARSSRGECPVPCDATTARSSSPTTHAPLSRTSGSSRKPLRPFSRSANPSSSVRWAHFPTTCLSFCRAFAATM